MSSLRRAGAKPVLLAVLGIVAVVAIVFWMRRSNEEDTIVLDPGETYELWCANCNVWVPVDTGEGRKLRREKKDGKEFVQCPKCQKFAGTWRKPQEKNTEDQGGPGAVSP